VGYVKTAAYKLNEYRIIEDENGLLRWETHYGFGVQRRGMCLIHDDILIIGPCSHEEIGYLKGEFLDRLEKLSSWNKTSYYCFASDLLDVASGRSLDQNFLDRMTFSVSISGNRAGPVLDGDHCTFRLEKYQITVATNGQVTWQAYGRMNRLLSGHCNIQSGVLFIGPEAQEKEIESKGDFFKKLDTLPRWDATKIWSRSLAFRPCHTLPQIAQLTDTIEKRTCRREGYARYEKFAMERGLVGQLRIPLPSRFKFRKLSWPHLHLPLGFRLRKRSRPLFRKASFRLIWLILLVVGGLLLGLIVSLHSVKERFRRFHSPENHHRE
jgi:hypothetical protein